MSQGTALAELLLAVIALRDARYSVTAAEEGLKQAAEKYSKLSGSKWSASGTMVMVEEEGMRRMYEPTS